jgi:hypothetical protein
MLDDPLDRLADINRPGAYRAGGKPSQLAPTSRSPAASAKISTVRMAISFTPRATSGATAAPTGRQSRSTSYGLPSTRTTARSSRRPPVFRHG